MIVPVKRILYIEILKEDSPNKGGIILPRPDTTNFEIAKVLAVGSEVKDFKKGDVIYVHYSSWETLEIGSNKGLIAEDQCFAKIEGITEEVES